MGKASYGAEAVAEALLARALGVRKGENVLIETWSHSLEYASACVVEARRRGASPVLVLEDEGAFWKSLATTEDIAHLDHVGSHEWALLEGSDAFVFFPGPADRPRFHRLSSPERGRIAGLEAEWFRRARRSGLRGVRCVLGYASDEMARFWGVDASGWRRALAGAVVDSDLRSVHASGQRVARALARGKELRVTSPNGTDLTLRLRARTPYVDDGTIGPDDRSLGRPVTISPPGSVVVSVDEGATEGIVVANRPSFVRPGRVESGTWEIHHGRLAHYSYGEGRAAWEEEYAKAPRGKDVVGLFAIGLNPSVPPGTPQVEDEEAGAVSIAIGGNASYGGANRCTYVSWLTVGEAMVAVDGRPLSDRGQVL